MCKIFQNMVPYKVEFVDFGHYLIIPLTSITFQVLKIIWGVGKLLLEFI